MLNVLGYFNIYWWNINCSLILGQVNRLDFCRSSQRSTKVEMASVADQSLKAVVFSPAR